MIKICDHAADILPDIEELQHKPDTVCPVQMACEMARAARMESCGKDVMCRDGLAQVFLLCESVTQGHASPSDLDLLRECCEVIALAGGCEMAVRCAQMILRSLELFAEEWADHVGGRKRCKALSCEAFCHTYIDPALCKGCGSCIAAAPPGAIAGGEGLISVVMQDAPLKHRADFTAICPNGAIKKHSGNVKPACPTEPVPVGSFGAGRRRRRG